MLTYRLLKGHACADGNKRLALILVSAFLELYGMDLEAEAEEVDHVFRQAAGAAGADQSVTIDQLAHWFGEAMHPLEILGEG